MAVAFRAIGTVKANTGNGNITSIGLPAGHVANDILVLVIHAADNVVCTVDQSYTLKLAKNGTATIRQEVWWKRDGGAEVAPTVTHALGDMAIARICAYSGCTTSGDPFSAGLQNSSNGTKTATSSDITPTANDVVFFAVTAATNTLDTSGASQGWSGYSGANPAFTERGDDFSEAGTHDLNGAEADGINTSGAAIGARTALEGWDYTAAATDNIAGMFALTAGAGAAVSTLALQFLGI